MIKKDIPIPQIASHLKIRINSLFFLMHQYTKQIHGKIRFAIFKNVGTVIIFRVGAEKAKHLVQEIHPPFTEEDVTNLPKYSMYLKLMIDGATSKAFSAETILLTEEKYYLKSEIKELSNKQF